MLERRRRADERAVDEAEGLEGALFKASVVDAESVNKMVEDIESELGPVDIVVFNATPDQPQMPIEEYDRGIS